MLFFCAWTLSAITLVSNGKPRAAVILPDDPFPVQKLAAEELIYHIKRATGAAGIMIHLIPFATCLSFKTFAAHLKSSILPFVQEPITT